MPRPTTSRLPYEFGAEHGMPRAAIAFPNTHQEHGVPALRWPHWQNYMDLARQIAIRSVPALEGAIWLRYQARRTSAAALPNAAVRF